MYIVFICNIYNDLLIIHYSKEKEKLNWKCWYNDAFITDIDNIQKPKKRLEYNFHEENGTTSSGPIIYMYINFNAGDIQIGQFVVSWYNENTWNKTFF